MDWIHDLLGINADKLTAFHMSMRAVFVFITALVYVRVAGIRTFGSQSSFDQITALMLGSVMGRAVVAADQPFFPSLLACLVIMVLHRIIAWISFISRDAGVILKGEPVRLFHRGVFQRKNMKKTHVTEDDIYESLRQTVNLDSLDKINNVYLERSGEISLTKKEEGL
jgi:uncharacterized membrane protein YcaP (DUF421 family)